MTHHYLTVQIPITKTDLYKGSPLFRLLEIRTTLLLPLLKLQKKVLPSHMRSYHPVMDLVHGCTWLLFRRFLVNISDIDGTDIYMYIGDETPIQSNSTSC